MYCKRTINILYKSYTDTRDDKILWQLIEECEAIIDIVISRWDSLNLQERRDTKQEMCLQLFRNLKRRTTENLQQYLIAPIRYLYFYIRMLAHRIYWNNYGVRRDSEAELPDPEMLSSECYG